MQKLLAICAVDVAGGFFGPLPLFVLEQLPGILTTPFCSKIGDVSDSRCQVRRRCDRHKCNMAVNVAIFSLHAAMAAKARFIYPPTAESGNNNSSMPDSASSRQGRVLLRQPVTTIGTSIIGTSIVTNKRLFKTICAYSAYILETN